jgi:hypothetical protein
LLAVLSSAAPECRTSTAAKSCFFTGRRLAQCYILPDLVIARRWRRGPRGTRHLQRRQHLHQALWPSPSCRCSPDRRSAIDVFGVVAQQQGADMRPASRGIGPADDHEEAVDLVADPDPQTASKNVCTPALIWLSLSCCRTHFRCELSIGCRSGSDRGSQCCRDVNLSLAEPNGHP